MELAAETTSMKRPETIIIIRRASKTRRTSVGTKSRRTSVGTKNRRTSVGTSHRSVHMCICTYVHMYICFRGHKLSPKGRIDLKIVRSRAKKCVESHGHLRFCITPQKNTKNSKIDFQNNKNYICCSRRILRQNIFADRK